jgi:hypothetical protein
LSHPEQWKVSFQDDFELEFSTFSPEVQDELLAAADTLRRIGPAAGRPHVGTLVNPKHPNMKELRFNANHGAEIGRAVFAFDPVREAIVLVAADKQGIDEKKFYRDLLKKANARFDRHLRGLKAKRDE